MATHISARLAWHNNGWNGRLCRNPAANTYCVGPYSFPSTKISDERDLEWEMENSGRSCADLDSVPPCCFSINCFGPDNIRGKSDPPEFYGNEPLRKMWNIPPYTICAWPFEEMYRDEVKKSTGGHDWDKRLERMRRFFSEMEAGRSLMFYYANYSNPFSEEDKKRYVIVGMARLGNVGEEMLYENCPQDVLDRYGGMVWTRNLTSMYPDQGLRIPYHEYMDQPEVLERILLTPENPRNFKYVLRHVSDDDALDIVEGFLEKVAVLIEIGDTSEDWKSRIGWLQSLIAELWDSRGLYPGLARVLDHQGFGKAIKFFKDQVSAGKEREAKDSIFSFLDGTSRGIRGLELSSKEEEQAKRQWQLRDPLERDLLRDVLPRFDIQTKQVQRMLEDGRESFGIYSSLQDIADNPYVLCEEYAGDGSDDTISFNKIDHGVFPSPDLGEEPLAERDDRRRLRALCVEKLQHNQTHAFLPATQVIHDINRKLSFFPIWKRHQFNERYFDVDKAYLSGALVFRLEDGKRFVYLRTVHEQERLIEDTMRTLASRPNIEFKTPMTDKHLHSFLFENDSPLATGAIAEEYKKSIEGQISVCEKVFKRPLCVVSGEAGTGKTTVIRALIQAIQRTEGTGATLIALAPTGKATDRIREKTGREASTIHSFLVRHNWMNDNFTFKRKGGVRESGISTYIIDEASMLDLTLTATLFKAIDWSSVKRLILVGDPNQLPPIGRGRAFADIIDWLEDEEPESVGILKTNMRQMENRISNRGTGILELASLYIRPSRRGSEEPKQRAFAEDILRKVQEGGDVDKDLRVLYWKTPDELAELLIKSIITDIEQDTGEEFDDEKPYEIWRAAFEGPDNRKQPDRMQVMSPYRGEQFGTDYINSSLQKHAQGRLLERIGSKDGITLFDKVIQFRNRPKSNKIWAYNTDTNKPEEIEVYNGELGLVKPHGFDKNKWKWPGFFLRRFQVVFARKDKYWVGFGNNLGRGGGESVEDNIELGYAISVHKSQGSEFGRVYFIVPKHKTALLSLELFYTGLTRASLHCTLLVEEDILPLVSMRRPERSHLLHINSSLFGFKPVPEKFLSMGDWYEEGKIHRTLADSMVRSKSEVIIANMLFDRDITFFYEKPLFAPDGTFYLPDFTIMWAGDKWYWEHLGLTDDEEYMNHWDTKRAWYEKFFPGKLVTTEESGNLSKDAESIIKKYGSSPISMGE